MKLDLWKNTQNAWDNIQGNIVAAANCGNNNEQNERCGIKRSGK